MTDDEKAAEARALLTDRILCHWLSASGERCMYCRKEPRPNNYESFFFNEEYWRTDNWFVRCTDV